MYWRGLDLTLYSLLYRDFSLKTLISNRGPWLDSLIERGRAVCVGDALVIDCNPTARTDAQSGVA